jgi:RNA polymerase sigma-70 factor, ECF subfamily
VGQQFGPERVGQPGELVATWPGYIIRRLLRDDVVFEMPPLPTWYTGREPVGRFLAAWVLRRPGRFRMIPVAANGQPAFAAYMRGNDGVHHVHAVQVLTITPSGLSRVASFNDSSLFAAFSLPESLARSSP